MHKRRSDYTAIFLFNTTICIKSSLKSTEWYDKEPNFFYDMKDTQEKHKNDIPAQQKSN